MRHMKRGFAASLGLAVSMIAANCGGDTPAITCGPGTALDKDKNECRVVGSPDLNVVVDDFSIGDFAFTGTDVPEQMQPGFPETRTFTITNTGEEAQDVTFVRVSVVKVNENIDELRTAIEDIGIEPSCESDADCSVSTKCNADGVCKLDPWVIGAVVIPNLAAGEQRQISYDLALPSDFDGTGVYGLMFSVNEVSLIVDTVNSAPNEPVYIEDPEHTLGTDDPFERAPALYAPATVLVGIPEHPNLRVLYAETDNHAFGVTTTQTPIMTVSGRLSAQGRDVTAPVHSRFELDMPGHVIETAGQDLGEGFFADAAAFDAAPAETTFVYDANRSFDLLVTVGTGTELAAQADLLPNCIDDECTESVTVENDLGRDISYELHLSPNDARLLEMTASLSDLYPSGVINDAGEIAGTVRLVVSTDEAEYEVTAGQPLLSDNEQEFEVAYFVPPAARDASDEDSEYTGLPEEAAQAPTVLPTGNHYAEVDNLSPTWSWSVGNEWMGAEARIQNVTSKARQFSALVAQRVQSENYARLKAMTLTFDIVNLSASIDYGTRRTLQQNTASGRLTLFGSNYLDITFQSPFPQCSTEDNFETCMILSAEFRPRKNEGTPARTPRQKKKFYVNYERGKSWFFAIGPLPFQVEIGIAAGLGMRATLALVQDRSANDADGSAYTTGAQVTVGPVADAGASAFGGLSLGLLRAGVRGTITFVSAELQPAVLIGQSQEMDENNNCWKANTGTVKFEAPLTLSVLSGDIKVVVEGGICGCLPWLGCACAWGEVFSYTILQIPPAWTNTWSIWGNQWDFNQGPGMCPGAPASAAQSWSSPKGCSDGSAATYCNGANGSGGYTQTFTRSSGCGSLVINGSTEAGYDFVTVRDSNGNQVIREAGNFTNRTVSYCAPSASVTLTTDGSVVRPGISVTAQ